MRCPPQPAKVQEAGCGGRGRRPRCRKQGAVHGLGVQGEVHAVDCKGAGSRVRGAGSGLLADQLHWPSRKRITPALRFGFAVDVVGEAFSKAFPTTFGASLRNVTAFRLWRPLKASSPMLVTLSGIVMLVRLLQSRKASSPFSLKCETIVLCKC